MDHTLDMVELAMQIVDALPIGLVLSVVADTPVLFDYSLFYALWMR